MTTATTPAPTLAFDAPTHTYTLTQPNGVSEVLPSVTTILKAVGLINFDGVPEHVLEAARARGSRCHLAAQYLTEGTLDWSSIAEDEKGYVEAYAAFLADAQFEVLAQEQRLYHPTYKVAGSCDFTGYWGGAPAVGDLKTGNANAVGARFQLAFYALMLRTMPPVEWLDVSLSTPIVRVSIELKRDGRYKSDVYRDADDFSVALAALSVFRAIEKQRRVA